MTTHAEWRKRKFEILAQRVQRVARWLPCEFGMEAVDWLRIAGDSGDPEAMAGALRGLARMKKLAAKERWPMTTPQKLALSEVQFEVELFKSKSTALN